MPLDPLHAQVEGFFSDRFAEHGATARGVDWQNEEAQNAYFDELVRIIGAEEQRASLVDYGCGYGALVPYLAAHGFNVDYTGFDLSESMIAFATATFADDRHRFVSDDGLLGRADYVVASGIFNVRFDVDTSRWTEHVLATLERFDALSIRGFAFNMLTSYSDPEKMRPDLFYGDGKYFFDVCKRRYAPNVALLHDYGRWQWTILVRKEAG